MNLFEMAQNNRLEELQNRITDINMTDAKGRTLLHYAVIGNAVETMLYLIKNGINVNAYDESGETVLFDCARRSKLEMAKILIANSANPNIANRRYELPIHIAAHRGDSRMIQLLVEAKSVLNKKTADDRELIHYAIMGGHVEIVPEIAVLTETSYFVKDEYGNGLLHYATRTSSLEMVKFLVDQKLDVNSLNDQFESPIFNAVKNGNLEIVKYLIKEEAFIDIKNRRYETPMDIAQIHDRDDIFTYLEEIKYEPSYQEFVKKQILTLSVLNRDYDSLRENLYNGARLRKNKLGNTAMDYAKAYNMRLAVNLLSGVKEE